MNKLFSEQKQRNNMLTPSWVGHVTHGVAPTDPEVWRAAGHLFDMVNGDLKVPLGVEGRVGHVAHKQVGPRTAK